MTRDMSRVQTSCQLLDAVERCAFGYYNGPNPNPDSKPFQLAFNARIKFYYRFFVSGGAKHRASNSILLDLCNYLRYIRADRVTRIAAATANMTEMQQMLAEVNAQEIYVKDSPVTYHFTDGYKLQDHEYMQELGRRLYRAIQGRNIKQELMRISQQANPTLVLPRTGGVITIREKMIDVLSQAAKTLSVAREWEAMAFTSCLGSSVPQETHEYERELAELLASIDFDTDPDEIIKEIKESKDKSKLKKYLKYKNKYLNLKKQLNLL
jgi:hypothetical protein